jgi:hypothetical protein
MNRAWETAMNFKKMEGLGVDILSSLSSFFAGKATTESIATLEKVVSKSGSSVVLVESINPNETPSTLMVFLRAMFFH